MDTASHCDDTGLKQFYVENACSLNEDWKMKPVPIAFDLSYPTSHWISSLNLSDYKRLTAGVEKHMALQSLLHNVEID